MKYKEIIEINGQKMTKQYIASLNLEQREALVLPMFKYFRNLGWMLPDFEPAIFKKDYQKLVEYMPDISVNETYNNTSLCNNVCQYFCRKSFYNTTERKNGKIKLTMEENFKDDDILIKICRNRLGIGWYNDEPQSTFNITPKMVLYQAQRSMRYISQISIFKAGIAKTIYLKYSKENDLVYDFSIGFGGRVLGALSCNRRYLGIDPLTVGEVSTMLEFFNFSKDNYKLIDGCSENYMGEENSIDFVFSSPPYYDQEYYSFDIRQAYNKGEDYFYNIYWKNTLNNIKFMLKPDKYFALNLGINYDRMFNMAKEVFGDSIDLFRLRTIRSHLNKTCKENATKYEPIYIFKNNKS